MSTATRKHRQRTAASYTASDVKRWRQGAKAYFTFIEYAPEDDWQKYSGERHDEYLGDLQALFMGEVPALGDGQLAECFPGQLAAAGIERLGEWVYDDAAVAAVMKRHPQPFAALKLSTPREAVRAVNFKQAPDAVERLLFGVPWDAVEAVAYANSLRIGTVIEHLELQRSLSKEDSQGIEKYVRGSAYGGFQRQASLEDSLRFIERVLTKHFDDLGLELREVPEMIDEASFWLQCQSVGVRDVTWCDYGVSPGSRRRIERLKGAFREFDKVEKKVIGYVSRMPVDGDEPDEVDEPTPSVGDDLGL